MKKAWRSDQDRKGSAKRRRLEFLAVAYNVKNRKDAFLARLKRNLIAVGECLCYKGTLDQKGYARLNLSYKATPETKAERITIGAHRLFLILKLNRPIRRGYEAGHDPICEHRTCVKHVQEEHYASNAAGGARTLNERRALEREMS